jgi:hypothetical protein
MRYQLTHFTSSSERGSPFWFNFRHDSVLCQA